LGSAIGPKLVREELKKVHRDLPALLGHLAHAADSYRHLCQEDCTGLLCSAKQFESQVTSRIELPEDDAAPSFVSPPSLHSKLDSILNKMCFFEETSDQARECLDVLTDKVDLATVGLVTIADKHLADMHLLEDNKIDEQLQLEGCSQSVVKAKAVEENFDKSEAVMKAFCVDVQVDDDQIKAICEENFVKTEAVKQAFCEEIFDKTEVEKKTLELSIAVSETGVWETIENEVRALASHCLMPVVSVQIIECALRSEVIVKTNGDRHDRQRFIQNCSSFENFINEKFGTSLHKTVKLFSCTS
jgi:hypothetical protein